MRKTARPVVWEGAGAQSPSPDPIRGVFITIGRLQAHPDRPGGLPHCYIRLVRYFLRRRQPQVARILLVESGSRHLIEHVLPGLRRTYGERIPIDLATCFAGAPEGIGETGGQIDGDPLAV